MPAKKSQPTEQSFKKEKHEHTHLKVRKVKRSTMDSLKGR
jgi:hypothetical protein